MAENQTEQNQLSDEQIIANSPFANAIEITRNGVSEFLKTFVGKRGNWDKRPYAAVQIETDPTKDLASDSKFLNGLAFFGKENIAKIVNVVSRRFGQDNVEDSTGEEGHPNAGIFSLDAFIKGWENFAAAGLKISELKELLDAEQTKFQDFVMNTAMNASPEEMPSIKEQIAARKSSIDALKFELAQRQQKRSKEVNTDEVRAQ